MKHPTHIIEFYDDDQFKQSFSIKASSTETALIIALIKLTNTTSSSLVNNYIMYDTKNKVFYKGEL